MKKPVLDIFVEETAGIVREHEPVTQGVPFPKGKITDQSDFHMMDDKKSLILMDAKPVAKWADGSIKWMLFDFQLSMEPGEKKKISIYPEKLGDNKKKCNVGILEVIEREERITVRTEKTVFELPLCGHLSLSRIIADDRSILKEDASLILLVDEKQREWKPRIDNWKTDTLNRLKCILCFEGSFVSEEDVHPLRYKCRIHFYTGKSTVRIDLKAWNPRSAFHAGGLWDLGDKGSILFHELKLELALQPPGQTASSYSLDVGEQMKKADHNILIYQDSSGGENWRSHNHINRLEAIPVTFRGYEVRNGQNIVSRGLRATPCLGISGNGMTVTASMKHFWQNFPKSIETNENKLEIGLFPKYFNDLFELQGGEKKNHAIYIDFSMTESAKGCALDWVHEPLSVRIDPDWYYSTRACPRPVPLNMVASDAHCAEYQHMVDVAVHGERSFFSRRELIDEYGWRNFGDVYADHETVFHKGPNEFISHYNNQYDIIKGAIIQFMRTGDPLWLRLANDLSSHVSDIDIYHTELDRYEYNTGLFWHTDHHLEAATSTHRSESRHHAKFKAPHLMGGGPSPSHNYTTGFLYHYWLTGEPASEESVIALADNITRCLEGSDIFIERLVNTGKTIIKWFIKKLKHTHEEQEVVYDFNGPGRSSGNALNTLLDGYLIKPENNYLRCAEKLIRRSVSPVDKIEDRDLLNAEIRWMYTIFLQSLGKYLDIKYEAGQLDPSFWYGRSVLLKYAEWMAAHEYPYLEKPEILEFPNETWAAQDIRKSDIMAHAALYSPEPLRKQLMERSRFFFEASIKQLKGWETRYLTRPIAILMSNGMLHMDTFFNSTYHEDIASRDTDYLKFNDNSASQRSGIVKKAKRMIKKTSLRRELLWIRRNLKKF